MINVEVENLLTVRQVTRHPVFRRADGHPCHISKIYRAVNPGYAGIRLETVRVPGGLRTSTEAIGRFVARLTNRANIDTASTPPLAEEPNTVDADLDRCGL